MGSKRARRYRQHSATDKVAILRKVLLEGQAVSAVCEEHDVSPALFYTWQKQFFENGAAAFAKDTSTEQRTLERTVAEVAPAADAEGPGHREGDRGVREDKKRAWGPLSGGWVPPDTRDAVIDFVRTWSSETAVPATRLVSGLGLGASKYFAWKQRYGTVNEHTTWVPRDHWLEPWEQQAIVDFARAHPREGYRRLTVMMLDQDVVAVSPTTVYRVLSKAGLLQPWNATPSKKGTGFIQPLAPHDHWHTDISYLNICGTFYYLCSVLDGCSRASLHWEIRESMTEPEVERVLQRTKEKYPGTTPRLISDNGPQFIARDFKQFVRLSGMDHVRTSPYYPQSNGKIERWHGSLKTEAVRPKTPLTVEDARRVVGEFVAHYNTRRLHSAIGYVTPHDRLAGRHTEIWEERDRKLEAARICRAARRAEVRGSATPEPIRA